MHADRAVAAIVDEDDEQAAPCWAAVASSCPFIMKSPSPATHSTRRSGKRIAAATAAGRP
jgi:hypothetical protein